MVVEPGIHKSPRLNMDAGHGRGDSPDHLSPKDNHQGSMRTLFQDSRHRRTASGHSLAHRSVSSQDSSHDDGDESDGNFPQLHAQRAAVGLTASNLHQQSQDSDQEFDNLADLAEDEDPDAEFLDYPNHPDDATGQASELDEDDPAQDFDDAESSAAENAPRPLSRRGTRLQEVLAEDIESDVEDMEPGSDEQSQSSQEFSRKRKRDDSDLIDQLAEDLDADQDLDPEEQLDIDEPADEVAGSEQLDDDLPPSKVPRLEDAQDEGSDVPARRPPGRPRGRGGRPRGRGRGRGRGWGRGGKPGVARSAESSPGRRQPGRPARGYGRGRGYRLMGSALSRQASELTVSRLPGRRRAPNPDAAVEAELVRQSELKRAYRQVMKALKPMLADMADKSLKDLKRDAELYKRCPEYAQVVAGLDDAFSKKKAYQEREYDIFFSGENSRFEEDKKSIHETYYDHVQRLQDDYITHCLHDMLQIVRDIEKDEDGEATEDEDESVKGGNTVSQISRSVFFIDTERSLDQFEVRKQMDGMLRQYAPEFVEEERERARVLEMQAVEADNILQLIQALEGGDIDLDLGNLQLLAEAATSPEVHEIDTSPGDFSRSVSVDPITENGVKRESTEAKSDAAVDMMDLGDDDSLTQAKDDQQARPTSKRGPKKETPGFHKFRVLEPAKGPADQPFVKPIEMRFYPGSLVNNPTLGAGDRYAISGRHKRGRKPRSKTDEPEEISKDAFHHASYSRQSSQPPSAGTVSGDSHQRSGSLSASPQKEQAVPILTPQPEGTPQTSPTQGAPQERRSSQNALLRFLPPSDNGRPPRYKSADRFSTVEHDPPPDIRRPTSSFQNGQPPQAQVRQSSYSYAQSQPAPPAQQRPYSVSPQYTYGTPYQAPPEHYQGSTHQYQEYTQNGLPSNPHPHASPHQTHASPPPYNSYGTYRHSPSNSQTHMPPPHQGPPQSFPPQYSYYNQNSAASISPQATPVHQSPYHSRSPSLKSPIINGPPAPRPPSQDSSRISPSYAYGSQGWPVSQRRD